MESGEFDHKLARLMFADDGTFPLATVEISAGPKSPFYPIHAAWIKSQQHLFCPSTKFGHNNGPEGQRSPPKKKVIRRSRPSTSPKSRVSSGVLDQGTGGDDDEDEMQQTSPPKRPRMINL